MGMRLAILCVIGVGLLAPPAVAAEPCDNPNVALQSFFPNFAPQQPVGGVPVAIDMAEPAGAVIVSTDWDLDDAAGFEEHTDGDAIVHTFSIGGHTIKVQSVLRCDDGSTTLIAQQFRVNAFADVDVTIRDQPRRSAIARGVRVRLAARSVPSVGAGVRVSVTAGQGDVNSEIVALPSVPTDYRVPLHPRDRRALIKGEIDGVNVIVTPGDQPAPDRSSYPPTLAGGRVTLRYRDAAVTVLPCGTPLKDRVEPQDCPFDVDEWFFWGAPVALANAVITLSDGTPAVLAIRAYRKRRVCGGRYRYTRLRITRLGTTSDRTEVTRFNTTCQPAVRLRKEAL